MKEALILVDIQNDFCPGGSLAVNDGDKIVPVVNALQKKFDLIIATQDWHPADHVSFAANHPGKTAGEFIPLGESQQILWPVHCSQGSKGAEFVAELDKAKITKVFQKGTAKMVDSYSGFFDNDHKNSTGLGDYLRAEGVEEVYITGLATDYCVKFTALDALNLGFKTNVVLDGCRGVNLNPGDVEHAVEEMKAAGIKVISSKEVK
jgi:nicotinamidase/pyrazinamidase